MTLPSIMLWRRRVCLALAVFFALSGVSATPQTPRDALDAGCTITGECQPCPPAALQTAPCLASPHYREPISCKRREVVDGTEQDVVVEAFRACGDVSVQRLLFFRFQTANVVLAVVAAVVIVWRKKALAEQHYARIVQRVAHV